MLARTAKRHLTLQEAGAQTLALRSYVFCGASLISFPQFYCRLEEEQNASPSHCFCIRQAASESWVFP